MYRLVYGKINEKSEESKEIERLRNELESLRNKNELLLKQSANFDQKKHKINVTNHLFTNLL